MERETSFDELLRLWQEGEASSEDLRELESLLREDPRRRRALVDSVLLEAGLYRRYSAAARRVSPFRKRVLEAVAALVLFGVSGAAVGYLLFRPEPTIPADASRPAELTLNEAILRALSRAPGIALKAALDDEEGTVAFEIEVASGKTLHELTLDARTGAVLEDDAKNEDRSRLTGALRITLLEAIDRALQAVPGRAVEAEFEQEGDAILAEVKVLGGGRLRTVKIDGRTGALLKVPKK